MQKKFLHSIVLHDRVRKTSWNLIGPVQLPRRWRRYIGGAIKVQAPYDVPAYDGNLLNRGGKDKCPSAVIGNVDQ